MKQGVEVVAELSWDGLALDGEAAAVSLDITFDRVTGDGLDNVAGTWETVVSDELLTLELEQEGTSVQGVARYGQPTGEVVGRIVPPQPRVQVGHTKQFRAVGVTGDFTWAIVSSSDAGAGSVDPDGLFSALGGGWVVVGVRNAQTGLVLATTETVWTMGGPTRVDARGGKAFSATDPFAVADFPPGLGRAMIVKLEKKARDAVPGKAKGKGKAVALFEFQAADEDGVDVGGRGFAESVQLTLHYDNKDLTGSAEDALVVGTLDEHLGLWQIVPEEDVVAVDTQANTITVSTSHASLWGVLDETTVSTSPAGDADGDGTVGFEDLFLFAAAFGLPVAEDSLFDLDGDLDVDLDDLALFFEIFGYGIGKVVARDGWPTADGSLQLEARSTESTLRIAVRSADLPLVGYVVLVEYDPARFRLTDVSDAESALRAAEREPLLLKWEEPGLVAVWACRTGDAGGVEGLLSTLHFEPLAPEAEGVFRIREAAVRHEGGQLAQPRQLSELTARWVPGEFALHPNSPNPFNPSTSIRYQLAAASPVRLDVYDTLGRRVRSLVRQAQPAGYHRVEWDSRDDTGQPVAAGVYFYRLQAGPFSAVRKLVLLK